MLDCLHFCQLAIDLDIKEEDNDLMKMIADLTAANKKLEEAKAAIQVYTEDEDRYIKMVSTIMHMGIDSIIDCNNKLIEKMQKMADLDEEGLRKIQNSLVKITTQKRDGWQTITISATWLLPIIVGQAQSENPMGPLPFKISKEERQELLKKLDGLFSAKLKEYEEYKKLQEENKQSSLNYQTWLIFTVAKIREMLLSETYEELGTQYDE
jgi:hypothetical protein